LDILATAELTTIRTEREIFYCLTGKGNRVHWYTKPKQTNEKWTKESVRGKETICDFHTHPRVKGTMKDCMPSVVDVIEWNKPKYDYKYHVIGCYPFQTVQVAIYDWEILRGVTSE
jgi:proteasome lid subunit RPN8/RPN11